MEVQEEGEILWELLNLRHPLLSHRLVFLVVISDQYPVPQSTEDEEAAERRARNLQRKQAQHLETGQDSPGLERQGSSGRRSIGGISGLSAAQLAEHYNNCIKLSAENKISAKNAFNLQLIDYMATMIKKKESDMNNFQVKSPCPQSDL